MSEAQRPSLLYVENEIFTQQLVEIALSQAGYDVWTASDGTEALEMLVSMGAKPCGLVTDIDLGECPNGWQIARVARTLLPALPVVYVSGASAHAWVDMGVADSVIVPKPFAPDQIVAALASLFARAV